MGYERRSEMLISCTHSFQGFWNHICVLDEIRICTFADESMRRNEMELVGHRIWTCLQVNDVNVPFKGQYNTDWVHSRNSSKVGG